MKIKAIYLIWIVSEIALEPFLHHVGLISLYLLCFFIQMKRIFKEMMEQFLMLSSSLKSTLSLTHVRAISHDFKFTLNTSFLANP